MRAYTVTLRRREVRAFEATITVDAASEEEAEENALHSATNADWQELHGERCDPQVTDIGMRMLTPREMYRAQGFPEDYRLDVPVEHRSVGAAGAGKRLGVTDLTYLVGNSVCPPVARALAQANLKESP